MGIIIRDAVNAPELRVFAQTAGQWAIQMLITNKMNSRIRYNEDRSNAELNVEDNVSLAPNTVPDLTEEYADLGDWEYGWNDEEVIQADTIGAMPAEIKVHANQSRLQSSGANIPGRNYVDIQQHVVRNGHSIPTQVREALVRRSSPSPLQSRSVRGGLFREVGLQNVQSYSVRGRGDATKPPHGVHANGTSSRGRGTCMSSARGRGGIGHLFVEVAFLVHPVASDVGGALLVGQ